MSLLISVVSAYSIFFIILNTIPQNEGQVHVLDTNDTKLIWCTINPAEQTKCLNLAHAVKRDRVMFKRDYFEVVCHEGFDKDECMALLDAEKVHITSADAGEVFIGGRYNSLVPIMQEVYEGGFKHYYSVAVIKRGSLSDVTSIDHLRGKKACFAGVGSLAGWIMPIHTLMKKGSMPIVDCNNHVKSAIEFFGHSCAINSLKDKYNPIGDNSDKLCKLCTGKIPGGKCTNADPYAGFEGAFRCLLEAGEVAFLKHSSVDEMISHGNEFSSISKDEFNLLCTDGSRRPLDDYRSCNWGTVPSHAIITTSAANDVLKRKYQEFLSVAVQLYSKKDSSIRNDTNRYDPNRYDSNTYDPNRRDDNFNDRFNYNGDRTDRFNNNDENRNRGFGNNGDENRNREFGNNGDENNRNRFGFNDDNGNFENEYNTERLDHYSSSPYPEFERNGDSSAERRPILYENFELFESAPLYGYRHNLLFQDNSRKLSSISEELQTYIGYLGKTLDIILEIRDCPVNRMTLCVTSDPELEKCIKMRTALKAQLLKPEMVCYKGHSHTHCMQAISAGNADVAVLDASDVYTGGLRYDLVPFMSEVYDLASNDYYAVAVAKEEDPTTDLTYMRGKYTCHTGIYTAAGWVYPLAYLISNGWIRSYGCNSIRAAAEYFTKSCVPGAISSEYNTDVPYDNMCDLCHGASYRYCRRDATEDYYGYTGALRCLVEGGGNVAFVKHTTVTENADGKRREWWARNILSGDFELLCPDGTRAEVSDYKKCNLGKVKSNAIVTRGGYGYNETQIKAYINLFVYAQQFYGRKDPDEFSFSMFYSIPPYSDLIFQDATKQLRGIPTSDRYYSTYLGRDFMRARRIVDCHASAPKTSHAFTLVIFTLTSLQLLYTFYL